MAAWLSDALLYTDSDGAIALAAGLDSRVVGALLYVGANGQPEATLMVAELAYRGVVTLTSVELEHALGQLATTAASFREGEPPAKRGSRNRPSRFPNLWDQTRDPGPWPFVQAACLLALPAKCRLQRANLVAEAALDVRSERIAQALCALADATTDILPLSEAGGAAVNAALAISLPPETKIVQQGRRRSAFVGGGRLAPGLAQVALGVTDHLDELAHDAGERAFQIAMNAPGGVAENIFTALECAGVDTSRRWSGFATEMQTWVSTWREDELALLADLGSLAVSDSSPNDGELWSLTELGDLLAVTGYQETGIGAFRRAFVRDSTEARRDWLDAIADAYEIDKSAVAKQARYLQRKRKEIGDAKAVGDDWLTASTKPLEDPLLSDSLDAKLRVEQKLALLHCLEADSDWIALAAANVLISITEPVWVSRELLEKDMSNWSRWRAGLVYSVAILSAGDDRTLLLTQAARSDLADHRYAARMAISAASGLDADGSVMATLCRDGDLSVRPKSARKTSPGPNHWTCNDCRVVNDLNVEDCPACDDGVRPAS